jgi:hypothetical protein
VRDEAIVVVMDFKLTASTCLPIPSAAPTAPPGATLLCADGDYSFSKTSKGACSRHAALRLQSASRPAWKALKSANVR